MKINNPIDEFILRGLERAGIAPSGDCGDEVFLRRASLDLTGTIPSLEEAKRFLGGGSASKRRDLIASLFDRKDYADYWAMKWCDLLRVKSEFPIKLWPNAVQAYARWIRTSLRRNMTYDRFVRELLTASGSNFRAPQANYYRALTEKTPLKTAEAVALNFMGARSARWPAARQAGMAAFFSRIGYKPTSEWKEEIVFFDQAKPVPAAPVFPDGTPARIGKEADPRVVFADWLIAPANPWFAKNIVNRIWSWLFGRGLIQEPDDIRDDNPPSHPDLLAWLEKELVDHGFDLRHVFRIVMESATYQLSSIPSKNNAKDVSLFSRYYPRRLEAEVLIDAICAITATTEEYSSPIPEPFTYVPWKQRTILLDDGSISSPFLDMFGRPPRDTGYESERNNDTSVFQVLHLLNSRHILSKIRDGGGMRKLVPPQTDRSAVVRNLYLAILSRDPRPEENEAVAAYVSRNKLELRDAMNDLAWALVNSKEFIFRH